MVAWDDLQEVRVYGFAEVHPTAYENVLALLALPPPAIEFVTERGDAIMLGVRDALASSVERTLFVASKEIRESILGARELSVVDWREILGFGESA